METEESMKRKEKKERKGTEKKLDGGMLGERQIADDATYRGAKLSKRVSIAYVSHFILLLHSYTIQKGRKEVRSSDQIRRFFVFKADSTRESLEEKRIL